MLHSLFAVDNGLKFGYPYKKGNNENWETSLSFYSFVSRQSFGAPYVPDGDDAGRVSINWVMPPPARESGGHINIFRFLRGLEARGFDCRVVVCNDGIGIPMSTTTDVLFRQINEWYGSFNGSVYYSDDMPPATMTMATGWQTAYCVKQFRTTGHKGYFVQDFEPSFFPAGAEAAFAEQTYKFGFTGYTAGSWLAELLRSKYGMKAFPASFSYDKNLYYRRPTVDKIKFILVGGDVDTARLEYPAFNPGSVRLSELGNLYSQCRAALILSFTNLSLLPLEVMSCGVPVISNKGDNVEWLLNEENSTLADTDPHAMAEAALKIVNLPDAKHEELAEKCIAFANRTNWEAEFDRLAAILNEQTVSLVPQAA